MARLRIFCLVLMARVLSWVSRVTGKGSGTALPGYVVEKYFPGALSHFSKQFDQVIMISGTNGKTTTRSLLVSIFESQGVEVCTNRGGANILRGIASSLLLNTNLNGQPKAKIAILEVEEATLPILVKFVLPHVLVITNVFRDQLDAYGEIDKTLGYFSQTLATIQDHKKQDPFRSFKVFVNRDDNKLLTCLSGFKGEVYGFALHVPESQKPKYEVVDTKKTPVEFTREYLGSGVRPGQFFMYYHNQEPITITTKLPGIYNLYNVLGAFLVGAEYFGEGIVKQIAKFEPSFGRGERIQLGDTQLQLLLVKNPAGFNQVLTYVYQQSQGQEVSLVMLVNDNIADGKDVSWLWDIDMENFVNKQPVRHILTSGVRGLDMLLRLEYAGLPVSVENYEVNLGKLIESVRSWNGPVYVLCTYTALLEFRKKIQKFVELKDIADQGN